MNRPFEVLGLAPTASAEEVRAAYRRLVKQCHPDKFHDPAARQRAQQKMIALNLAYEEAYHLASSRRVNTYTEALPLDDAFQLADKMLRQHSPESALRQLMRSETRDARWYAMQGRILFHMEQYDSAHQSYREAVRRDPDNNTFRQGALDAAVAMKQSKTLRGRIKRLLRKKQHR